VWRCSQFWNFPSGRFSWCGSACAAVSGLCVSTLSFLDPGSCVSGIREIAKPRAKLRVPAFAEAQELGLFVGPSLFVKLAENMSVEFASSAQISGVGSGRMNLAD
jgi:hypothetical protein